MNCVPHKYCHTLAKYNLIYNKLLLIICLIVMVCDNRQFKNLSFGHLSQFSLSVLEILLTPKGN